MEIHPILESCVSPNHSLWYVLSALGDCPSMRVGHTAVSLKDSQGKLGKVAFIGGANPRETYSDVHTLDLDTLTWNSAPAEGFLSRYEHACFVPESSPTDVFIMAGATLEDNLLNVQCYNVASESWRTVQTSGTSPCPRTHHSSAAIGDCIYLYSGGKTGPDPISDRQVHVFNAKTVTWSTLSLSGESPSPRLGHTMCAVGQKIVVFGGMSGTKVYNDVHILDTNKLTWNEIKQKKKANLPCARASHVAVSCGTHMYVFGGMGKDQKALDDIWKFDVEAGLWTLLKLKGPPPACRLDMASCVIPWLAHGEISSTTSEQVQKLNQDLEGLSVAGNQVAGAGASGVVDSEGDGGVATNQSGIMKLLLIHGGMDTQAEIFDDCLVYRLE